MALLCHCSQRLTRLNMTSFPPSKQLNLEVLGRLFEKTTNSYKYLFFLSILNIVHQQTGNSVNLLLYQTLTVEMLTLSWYPHFYSQLSFGTQDKIPEMLNGLTYSNFLQFKPPQQLTQNDLNQLRKNLALSPLDALTSQLMRYVPYRLIRPFFELELFGEKDGKINRKIRELSEDYFESRKPLYYFDVENQGILIHPEWQNYLSTSYNLLWDWAFWEWVDYLQACNPKISDIASRLLPPKII